MLLNKKLNTALTRREWPFEILLPFDSMTKMYSKNIGRCLVEFQKLKPSNDQRDKKEMILKWKYRGLSRASMAQAKLTGSKTKSFEVDISSV